MEKRTLNLIFYAIFILILSSCGNNSERKKVNRNDNQTEQKSDNQKKPASDYVYSEGNKKVELILENGVKYLEVGKPTRADFPTENINDQRFMISGPGIMVNRTNRNEFRFTITPIKETLVNGNLEINVTESVDNGENFTHKFLVPVINQEEKN